MLTPRLRPLASVLVFFAGCGGGAGVRIERMPADAVAQGYILLPKPVSVPRGQVSYDCGAESLAAVLAYWGKPAEVESLANLLVNPELKSTDPTRLILVARQKGLAVNGLPGSVGLIKQKIDAARPPIIMVQLTKTGFHYYVVSAYNDRTRTVVCEEVDGAKRLYSYDDLDARWKGAEYFFLDLALSTAAEDFEIGAEAEKRGDWSRAMQYFKRALAADPEFFEAHVGMGNCLLATGKLEESKTHYEAAYRLNQGDPKVCNNLANVYVELGVNLELAEQLAGKAVDSFAASCLRLEGAVQSSKTEIDKSERKKELREREVELAFAQGTLGQARFKLEKWALAVAAWKASLDQMPLTLPDWRARRHLEIARAQRKLGMESEARSHLGQALEIAKDPALRKQIEEALK